MASKALRRLVNPRDPEEVKRVTNALVDMALGNQGGRQLLVEDGGDALDIRTGAVLSSGNYTQTIRSTATGGAHQAVLLSATTKDAVPSFANSVQLITDTGLGIGAGKTLSLYHTDGTTSATIQGNASGQAVVSAISVTGAASVGGNMTVTGTLGVTGALTANGAVTLGDAAGDAITINGTSAVNAPMTIAASTYLAFGATPSTTGEIRLTFGQGIYSKNSGGTDVLLMGTSGTDRLTIGNSTNIVDVLIFGSAGGRLLAGSSSKIRWDATGIGMNGTAPVAKGTVTGSRGGVAALASLLSYLASRGDITDSSSA